MSYTAATTQEQPNLDQAQAGAPADAGGSAPSSFKHCTYADCLTGRAAVPTDKTEKFLFQLLMVGGMVTFMATINGVLHLGPDFFAKSHWVYPLVFSIAFTLRTYVAAPLGNAIIKRLVTPRFTGVPKGVLSTIINVSLMAPLMSMIMTLLLQGTDHYLASLASVLPLTPLIACLINFFVVGPIVKKIYNNHLRTKNGMALTAELQHRCMNWTWLFGN